MFNFKEMPHAQTASSLFAAYASFATSMMLIRSMTNDLLPPQLFSFLSSIFSYFFPSKSSQTTLVIENQSNFLNNQVYESAEIYLRTKITPSMDRLKVSKSPRQQKITLSMEKDQEIVDHFEHIRLKWRYVSDKKQNDNNVHGEEKRYYELVFDKKFMGKVVDLYLPYILRRAKEIKEMETVAKLCSQNCSYDYDGGSGEDGCRGSWRSICLEHPATFDTLAVDPGLKKMIIDDLDRFVKRKEFYGKVGKAWKRGYLLYGPPGTGKSSLIAAMANYLKFDIYDLDLTDIHCNSQLRESLLSTTNRSILVIEDIDCSVNLQNRENSDNDNLESSKSGLTLSGMLNFMDGLWSSCGDERIIVLTTNHKDRLDPALLRPGRMDVHINLTYCTSKAFEVLAINYLGGGAIRHRLYGEIQGLIDCVNVTPAEVAEELMKGEDIDIVMEGLAKLLKVKREEQSGENEPAEEKVDEVLVEEKVKKRKGGGGVIRYRRGFIIGNRSRRSPSLSSSVVVN